MTLDGGADRAATFVELLRILFRAEPQPAPLSEAIRDSMKLRVEAYDTHFGNHQFIKKMKAIDTQIVKWVCPDCEGEQVEILVVGLDLPPILECPDCGHKSDEIDWKDR